jgi:hypothetical protein
MTTRMKRLNNNFDGFQARFQGSLGPSTDRMGSFSELVATDITKAVKKQQAVVIVRNMGDWGRYGLYRCKWSTNGTATTMMY